MKSFRLLLFGTFLFFQVAVFAQNTETRDKEIQDSLLNNEPSEEPKTVVADTGTQGPDWDMIKKRLVFGGNLGLSFFPSGNSVFTIFQISPQVGYKVKENIIVGGGLQFLSITSGRKSYIEAGPDIFVRAHAFGILFAQAQFEYLNFEDYLLPGKRVWNPAMLVGAGYGTYGYSLGIYTNLIQNRFSDQIYPGNFYIGNTPFFFRGQILF